jgi:hypothetical protein
VWAQAARQSKTIATDLVGNGNTLDHSPADLDETSSRSLVRGSIEAQRRNGLLLTRRWRELDSNFQFREGTGWAFRRARF